MKNLLYLLLIVFTGCLIKAQTSNMTTNSFPFTIRNNKTIVKVKIDNVRPLRIILDSGMGWDGLLIINPDLRDSINLVSPDTASLGGAGQGNSQTALVSDSMSYSIGNVQFKNHKIVVLQSDHYRGTPSDGVTGYSIFGYYAVEINYDDSTITLHNPNKLEVNSTWSTIPIYFKDNSIPWIDLQLVIDNETPIPISCYIDYASSEAIELLLKDGQKFVVPEKVEDAYLGRGLSGDITGQRGYISKIILGKYELENVLATFTPAEVRSKQKEADGVVASNLLRRFNIIFDYSNEKLYLRPNSNFNKPF